MTHHRPAVLHRRRLGRRAAQPPSTQLLPGTARAAPPAAPHPQPPGFAYLHCSPSPAREPRRAALPAEKNALRGSLLHRGRIDQRGEDGASLSLFGTWTSSAGATVLTLQPIRATASPTPPAPAAPTPTPTPTPTPSSPKPPRPSPGSSALKRRPKPRPFSQGRTWVLDPH